MAAETKKKETKERKVVIKKEPIPQLATGDGVKVSMRIIEGDKERIQVFQGIVIKIHPAADGGNFTVRRVAYGVGVERTFPYASPLVARVELLRHGKVRRARLFYLRELSGKAARIKEKRIGRLLPDGPHCLLQPYAAAFAAFAQRRIAQETVSGSAAIDGMGVVGVQDNDGKTTLGVGSPFARAPG